MGDHLETGPYMIGGSRQWRRCYGLRERERNDALEQRMQQLEVFLTSIGVSHVSHGAHQSPPTNGGSTSSVSSASACMINIV
jgi:hypothetical protein